jgi:hypothetical protein
MDELHDKKMAKMLLELRADDGFTIRWLVREKARRFSGYFLSLAVILGVLAFCGWWLAFSLLISFAAGVGFCYLHWFRSRQRHWPLDKRIIDWDVVKKISEDEPSA